MLPLVKREGHLKLATEIHAALLERCVAAEHDSTQSIGKRYRRQDAIGTPLCITVDDSSVSEATVTVRDRDSMAQVRLPISEVLARGAARTLTPALLFK